MKHTVIVAHGREREYDALPLRRQRAAETYNFRDWRWLLEVWCLPNFVLSFLRGRLYTFSLPRTEHTYVCCAIEEEMNTSSYFTYKVERRPLEMER